MEFWIELWIHYCLYDFWHAMREILSVFNLSCVPNMLKRILSHVSCSSVVGTFFTSLWIMLYFLKKLCEFSSSDWRSQFAGDSRFLHGPHKLGKHQHGAMDGEPMGVFLTPNINLSSLSFLPWKLLRIYCVALGHCPWSKVPGHFLWTMANFCWKTSRIRWLDCSLFHAQNYPRSGKNPWVRHPLHDADVFVIYEEREGNEYPPQTETIIQRKLN